MLELCKSTLRTCLARNVELREQLAQAAAEIERYRREVERRRR